MKGKKVEVSTRYGKYHQEMAGIDADVFHVRHAFIMLSDEYKAFCLGPGIDEIQMQCFDAWQRHNDFSWFDEHNHLMKSLLIFGNVHKLGKGFSATTYQNAYDTYQTMQRQFPFHVLQTGDEVPAGYLTFSVDPAIPRHDIVRMFEQFLTQQRTAPDAPLDPLYGYFNITEKRVDWQKIARYLHVWQTRIAHPKSWQNLISKVYQAEYPAGEESRRRTILRDFENAQRISYWLLRGRFPCTKQPK